MTPTTIGVSFYPFTICFVRGNQATIQSPPEILNRHTDNVVKFEPGKLMFIKSLAYARRWNVQNVWKNDTKLKWVLV